MIKDLFHTPPHYKANITLSWRPAGRLAEKRRLITAPATAASKAAKGDANGNN